MKLLLDTHLLIWAASDDPALSEQARSLIEDPPNMLYFSTFIIWEIVIERSIRRPDFQLDARIFRTNLLDAGYTNFRSRLITPSRYCSFRRFTVIRLTGC